jgi:hypothetical protein
MPGSRRHADEKFLMALAFGATVESAAHTAGISDRTAYRRMNEPAFRKRLQKVRDDIVQRTAGAVTAAWTESVKTLLSLQQPTVSATVRLGAARAILEIGIRLREITDLAERIAALEGENPASPATPSA